VNGQDTRILIWMSFLDDEDDWVAMLNTLDQIEALPVTIRCPWEEQ